MFCPPGYVVMHRIEATFRKVAIERHALPSVQGYAGDMATLERDWRKILERRGMEQNEAMARFLRQCMSLSICTQAGLLMRISPTIVSREPEKRLKGYRGYWWFIDTKTWTLTPTKAERWLEKTTERRQQLSYGTKMWKGTDDARLEDDREELAALIMVTEQLEYMIETCRRFAGSALTVAEADAPTVETAVSFFDRQDEPTAEDEEIGASHIGRPAKQAAAKAAYQHRYPNGHGNESWKVVLKALVGDMGQPISESTLKRALGIRSKPKAK